MSNSPMSTMNNTTPKMSNTSMTNTTNNKKMNNSMKLNNNDDDNDSFLNNYKSQLGGANGVNNNNNPETMPNANKYKNNLSNNNNNNIPNNNNNLSINNNNNIPNNNNNLSINNNNNNLSTNNNNNNLSTNNNNNNSNFSNTNNNLNLNNNSMKNPMVKNFIDFVNIYAKIDKIDDKVLEIVNTGFKKSSKFSTDVPQEASMHISEDNMESFCVKNVNDKTMIPIALDDPRLKDYINIYNEMKKTYIKNCEYLFDVLETKILKKSTPKDDKDENLHFMVNNIGYSDLVGIETDVRNKLISMYTNCHEQYQKGIVSLYNALQEKKAE